jgi:hypothetical protein
MRSTLNASMLFSLAGAYVSAFSWLPPQDPSYENTYKAIIVINITRGPAIVLKLYCLHSRTLIRRP